MAGEEQTITTIQAGLIGAGIQASRSPAMHMREGAENGFSYHYDLIDTEISGLGAEDLPSLLAEVEQQGFSGVNITHPYKQRVMPLLTSLSDEARAVGAVNTVLFRDSQRIGHNTDWWGFTEAFRRGLPAADSRSVLQLGAGGAGSATAYALLRLGTAKLAIFDVDDDRADELIADLRTKFPDRSIAFCRDLDSGLRDAAGLVHATPMGMASHPGLPLPAALLHPGLWVAEVVYFPLETALLREARARGCRCLDGGGMAVFQAAEAFRLFTGITPDAGRMLAHFRAMVPETTI